MAISYRQTLGEVVRFSQLHLASLGCACDSLSSSGCAFPSPGFPEKSRNVDHRCSPKPLGMP